jgi:hypothetical protein
MRRALRSGWARHERWPSPNPATIMKSRRTFLLSLPLVTVGAAAAETETKTLLLDGVDSAKTVEELKKSVPLALQWKEATYAKRKFLFAQTSEGDGESYIDLHGWIYNLSFKEWRRILKIKTRGLGTAELLVDEAKGVVSLRGKANDEFNGVDVFRFDLRATSDDAGYVR